MTSLNSAVRAEGRIHSRLQAGCRDRFVVFQAVGRIVRSTESAHVKTFEYPVDAQVIARQQGIGALPDFGSGVCVQQVIDSEVAVQFQMRPVIERITQRVGDRARPRLEFFIGRGIAAAVTFGHAVHAHCPPFVVVAFQPDLIKVVKAPVAGYLSGRKMIVVVQHRLFRRVGFVKRPGGLALQQEVFANEGHIGRLDSCFRFNHSSRSGELLPDLPDICIRLSARVARSSLCATLSRFSVPVLPIYYANVPRTMCLALLFDLDGVLVDSTAAVARVWSQWAAERGFDPEETVTRAHGRPSIRTIRELLPHADHETENRGVEKREIEDLEGGIAAPGAGELLASLPTGV